eukprot:4550273-Pleurochrysis_carterae.AAC.1
MSYDAENLRNISAAGGRALGAYKRQKGRGLRIIYAAALCYFKKEDGATLYSKYRSPGTVYKCYPGRFYWDKVGDLHLGQIS